MKSRLFFVVDSETINEEIFETLEEARAYANDQENFISDDGEKEESRIWICIVRNTYKEDGRWQYEDLADTFDRVSIVKK